MADKKRYSVTLDAYIYARNDQEAMVKAAKLVDSLQCKHDNQAQVIKLEETPFASCASRLVHTGRLLLFDNKLIK
jgi:hypothetical protein